MSVVTGLDVETRVDDLMNKLKSCDLKLEQSAPTDPVLISWRGGDDPNKVVWIFYPDCVCTSGSEAVALLHLRTLIESGLQVVALHPRLFDEGDDDLSIFDCLDL